MRRQATLACLAFGGLVAHACALPKYGTDAKLDPQGGAGSTSQTAGGTATMTDGGAASGSAGAPEIPEVVEAGTPCTEDAKLACQGAAQQERLVCDKGIWTATDACPADQNCDQSTGECQPIVEQCAGNSAGKRFCSENDLVECGPDLVSTTVVDSCDKCVETGTTAECVPMGCGDHTREAPEQCDDGNKDDTDACTSACKVAHCGDTAIWKDHETCDDGNATTEVCEYGKKACTVCNSGCQEVAGQAQYCGDGSWQKDLEECDSEWEETANQCSPDCESTTWALWHLPFADQKLANYAWSTGIVHDLTTNLVWQTTNDAVDRTWEEAKAYCLGLELGQSSDWRLPTRIELMSIVDYTISGNVGPMINLQYFKGATAEDYWTSSLESGGNDFAFSVSFKSGGSTGRSKALPMKVRCVHS